MMQQCPKVNMSKETDESLSVFFYKSWIFFFFFCERYNGTMGQRDWISVHDILARKPVCWFDFQVWLRTDYDYDFVASLWWSCKLKEQSEMWAFVEKWQHLLIKKTHTHSHTHTKGLFFPSSSSSPAVWLRDIWLAPRCLATTQLQMEENETRQKSKAHDQKYKGNGIKRESMSWRWCHAQQSKGRVGFNRIFAKALTPLWLTASEDWRLHNASRLETVKCCCAGWRVPRIQQGIVSDRRGVWQRLDHSWIHNWDVFVFFFAPFFALSVHADCMCKVER